MKTSPRACFESWMIMANFAGLEVACRMARLLLLSRSYELDREAGALLAQYPDIGSDVDADDELKSEFGSLIKWAVQYMYGPAPV